MPAPNENVPASSEPSDLAVVSQRAELEAERSGAGDLQAPLDEIWASAHTDAELGELRVLRPKRAAPADAVRPTRAEINLGHLRHNLHVLSRALEAPGGGRPQVWGVLKADAYGHGAPAVARTLERAGIDGLAVALLEEGLELRSAGIRLPILVMGGYYGPHHRGLEDALEAELTPVLYHEEQLERLAGIARLRDRGSLAFHLKIDSGMGRLGAAPSEVEALYARIVELPELRLEGLMSHLACADAPSAEPTRAQARRFESFVARAAERRLVPLYRHLANSAGAIAFPEARYDAVRPGIALFGHSPFFPREVELDLRPVMRVKSEIVALRELHDGDAVGYGHTYVVRGQRRIATIAMGYADGLSRGLSNRGEVLVRGRRAPIAGIVSMDLTTIDVTDIPGVSVGDEAVVLGSQEGPLGSDSISAAELADRIGTIPWEVVTQISRRVPRFYREP
jgi:alanine racemase